MAAFVFAVSGFSVLAPFPNGLSMPSRDAPGYLGSGKTPGLASPQPGKTTAMAATTSNPFKRRFKAYLLPALTDSFATGVASAFWTSIELEVAQ